VINLPRDGSVVQIYLESGRKGPKSSPDASSLEVTDWCTKPFDEDAASFRLPANADGYAVYSRVTGKPVDNHFFEVFGRDLTAVEVECQVGDTECPASGTYDLLLLGVVNEDGAFTKVGNGDGNFERVDSTDGRGGKGVKNATDITGMFEFSGQVCYVYADDPACTDSACAAADYCCPIDEVRSGSTRLFTATNTRITGFSILPISWKYYSTFVTMILTTLNCASIHYPFRTQSRSPNHIASTLSESDPAPGRIFFGGEMT
jgi:hypothetical protein